MNYISRGRLIAGMTSPGEHRENMSKSVKLHPEHDKVHNGDVKKIDYRD